MNDVKELERPAARHDEPQDKPSSPKKPPRRGKGVAVRRYYTVPGIHPFEKIEWERRVARLTDVSGKVIFEQADVEVPTFWSQTATNIVAQKYFHGALDTPQREQSVKQLIDRVARTIAEWGRQDGYFSSDEDAESFYAELAHLLAMQKASFNSPVWFNVGVQNGTRPQCSACFINSVDDTMESILDLAKTEGILFKYGSGTGTNLSPLRSSKERLSGGGKPSGPVSFMKGYDAFAGVIKCLTPDTYIYTTTGMIRMGEFISASLPEGFHPDDQVILATEQGKQRISHVYVSPESDIWRVTLGMTGLELKGTAEHPILTMNQECQLVWKTLGQIEQGDYVAVARHIDCWAENMPTFEAFSPELVVTRKQITYPTRMTQELARLLGYMVSEGCMDEHRVRFVNADKEVFDDFLSCFSRVFGVDVSEKFSTRINPKTGVVTYLFHAEWKGAAQFFKYVGLTCDHSNRKIVPQSILRSPKEIAVEFLRAYFEGDGHVSRLVYCASASEELLRQIQQMLLNFGIISVLRRKRIGGVMYFYLNMQGAEAKAYMERIGFVSRKKQQALHLPEKRNTNIDVVPYLVEALRNRSQSCNGYYACSDGRTRKIPFGFFNRTSQHISYARLEETADVIPAIRLLDEQLAETIEWVMKQKFFWDRVAAKELAGRSKTYDVTVPETHSFIANGIVCHNSGGKTRRAAKMVILNMDHPDIEEYITCKATEEKKAHALIDMGYNPDIAYESVFFQNANNSVRVTDAFMQAALEKKTWQTKAITTGEIMGEFQAKTLLQKIAESTHLCGDPGMQYDTTINAWHTCPNSGRIDASNPCVTGDTFIGVADGRNAVTIRQLAEEGKSVPVYCYSHDEKRLVIRTAVHPRLTRRNAPIVKVTLDDGSFIRTTPDHQFMLKNGTYSQAKDLTPDTRLMPFHSFIDTNERGKHYRAIWRNNGYKRRQYRMIWEFWHGEILEGMHVHHRDFNQNNDHIDNLVMLTQDEHKQLHRQQMMGKNNPAHRCMNEKWREHLAKASRGENNPRWMHISNEELIRIGQNFKALTGKPLTLATWNNHAEQFGVPQLQRTNFRFGTFERFLALCHVEKVHGSRKDRVSVTCPVCGKNFEVQQSRSALKQGKIPCCSKECGYLQAGKASSLRQKGKPSCHQGKISFTQRMKEVSNTPEQKEKRAMAGRQKAVKLVQRIADFLSEHRIEPTIENWEKTAAAFREATGSFHYIHSEKAAQLMGGWANVEKLVLRQNHRVVSVVEDGFDDVYNLTVEDCHNYAVMTKMTGEDMNTADFSGIVIKNCAEYLFVNNSACNLSSLNVMRFRSSDGEFDAESFTHAVDIMIIAQDIIVDNSSYPTRQIEENSHLFRPLGLGYTNLGALLMARGLPYDSDAGRAYAAAITAILCGQAYKTSAMLARARGAFDAHAQNAAPMLNVIRKHGEAVNNIDAALVPPELIATAQTAWRDALESGQQAGFRNAQVTVLAPTGTISFMMDCDTTGIEPELALIKYKHLAGGGSLKMINGTVPEALARLGYADDEQQAILAHLEQRDTIENAPFLKRADWPVFDCAFPPKNGQRVIHYMGHLKMMAAVQPFISGGISKTVNVPHSATVEEIIDAYVTAWKLGLKAVAIYRDGSKRMQPLTTSTTQGKPKPETIVEFKPVRRRLPDEREAMTKKFSVAGHKGYVTVGMYEDGAPGELFIVMSKEGSTISGLMDGFATAISLALQYGVPLHVLVNKFAHMRFEPAGFTGDKDIPIAKSILDYIFRWLALKFLTQADRPNVLSDAPTLTQNGHAEAAQEWQAQTSSRVAEAEQRVFQEQADAPPCSVCGAIMVRSGTCYKCLNCGTTSGCS